MKVYDSYTIDMKFYGIYIMVWDSVGQNIRSIPIVFLHTGFVRVELSDYGVRVLFAYLSL